MNASIEQIKKVIEQDRQALLTHPLYKKVERLDQLQLFTEQHVYAVFDFMSLLKTLQQLLTCVQVPWVPVGTPNTRYLINEIVLGEESEEDNFAEEIIKSTFNSSQAFLIISITSPLITADFISIFFEST